MLPIYYIFMGLGLLIVTRIPRRLIYQKLKRTFGDNLFHSQSVDILGYQEFYLAIFNVYG